MSTNHHIKVCREHDVMLSQCRCAATNKQRIEVPCPGDRCPGTREERKVDD